MFYTLLLVGKLLSAALVGLGITIAFRGYQIFRALMAVLGFWVGTIGVVLLGGDAINQGPWILVPAVVAGAVCAVLAWYLYVLSVFLVGALGGVATTAAAGLLITEWYPSNWQLLTAACAAGAVVVALDKLAIIVSTATTGAGCICVGGAFLIGLSSPEWVLSDPTSLPVGLVLLWIPLTIAGIVAQYHAPMPDSSRRLHRGAGVAGDGDAEEPADLRSGLWAPVVGTILFVMGVSQAWAALLSASQMNPAWQTGGGESDLGAVLRMTAPVALSGGIAMNSAGFEGRRRSWQAWRWIVAALALFVVSAVLRTIAFADRDWWALAAGVHWAIVMSAAVLWFAWRGRRADALAAGGAKPPSVGLMVALSLLVVGVPSLANLAAGLRDVLSGGLMGTEVVGFCLTIATLVGALVIGTAWLRGARSSAPDLVLALLALSAINGLFEIWTFHAGWETWLVVAPSTIGIPAVVAYYLWRYQTPKLLN